MNNNKTAHLIVRSSPIASRHSFLFAMFTHRELVTVIIKFVNDSTRVEHEMYRVQIMFHLVCFCYRFESQLNLITSKFKTSFSCGLTVLKQPAVTYHYEAATATAAIQLSKLGQRRASNRAPKTTEKHSNFGLQTPYKIVCKSKRNLASKCHACRTCHETFTSTNRLHEHLRASGYATPRRHFLRPRQWSYLYGFFLS